MAQVAVMGAGSWGTTLAKVFADAGSDVRLWVRRPELAQAIAKTHINADYLPNIELPASIATTTDAQAALRGAEIVVFAVPSQAMRLNLANWNSDLPPDATLVSISKGIEKEDRKSTRLNSSHVSISYAVFC